MCLYRKPRIDSADPVTFPGTPSGDQMFNPEMRTHYLSFFFSLWLIKLPNGKKNPTTIDLWDPVTFLL